MTKHTLGPWEVYHQPLRPQLSMRKIIEIQRQGGEAIIAWSGFDSCELPEKTKLANAKRIVACVNACVGINPEAVKDLVAFTQNILADATPGPHPRIYETPEEIRNAANAALAKAKLP